MNYELFDHWEKKIYLINMLKEDHQIFSELFEKGVKNYLQAGKKIWILINKKWHTWGTICKTCGHIPQCDRCSVAIHYYLLPNWEKVWMCHICKKQYQFPKSCEQCNSPQIQEYGIGTQKLAELIKKTFWAESLIIESESVRSPKKIEKLSSELQKYQNTEKKLIIIWTSLLTTPIKDRKFDLLIFVNADIGLNLPDFNASEKNFYFLYEAFLKHQCKSFLVQTMNPDHHSIRNACKLNKSDFFAKEYQFRKQYSYPPFWELCLILYKDEIEQKLFNKVDQLYKELLYLQEKYQLKELEIYTTPPLVYKIFGKYRYNIVIKGEEVRNFMDIVYSKLQLNKKGFKINRNAESII